ncbi:MAG TPA: hypothetical protein VF691_13805 [Cytophagaceae bacterium]|jgi:hypothetical protein
MKSWLIKNGFKAVVFCLLFFVLIGGVTMSLWNYLVPQIFNGPQITFIQAVGILLLSKILFGGFKPNWSKCGCEHMDKTHWRKRWEDKIAGLSPEEKERFRTKMAGKCGWWNDDKATSANT